MKSKITIDARFLRNYLMERKHDPPVEYLDNAI